MSDLKVLETQQWLNSTYGGHPQWRWVQVDGQTGWGPINGLIRALQIELGITTLADTFGPTTMAQFVAQIGSVGAGTANTNVVRITQGALWCKGYQGGYSWGTFDSSVMAGINAMVADMGLPATQVVAAKIMRALLTMDAYVLIGDGTSGKREVQRWLNRNYSHREEFALLPCDGLYNRNTQQGMMYAIQYEAGMADGVANGNFGPGTRSALQTQAAVSNGDIDGGRNWVRLFQGALRFNDYDASFSGTFDETTVGATLPFQSYAELAMSGSGDFGTWASLLISTGDETRPGIASDMATQLTPAHCADLYANGYRTVGRYLTVTTKRYRPGELQDIFAAGLRTFPIMQEANTAIEDFTEEIGRDHGFQALRRLRQLGFASGTTVFLAVDVDALDDDVSANIIPYFQGINAVLNSTHTQYVVGIYGTRNVCTRVIEGGLASEAFIASLSWGWSGNLGYKLPPSWSYDQIAGETLSLTSLEIDKNVQSHRANPVGANMVAKTPVVQTASGQQFDEQYFWWLTEQCVRAEQAACQNFLSSGYANWYVLHRIQREKYWYPAYQPSGESDALWNVYTPLPEYTSGMATALANAISYGRGVYESAASSPPTAVLGRLSHWAASTLSYLTWGVPQETAAAETGDLGAWALDLATLWREFYDNVRPSFAGSVREWFAANIGAAASNTFDAEDFYADVDAYLCARRLRADSTRAVSDVIREIETGEISRFSAFASERFGTRANAEAAVVNLFTSVNLSVDWPIKLKIGNTPKPTGQELLAVAAGFAYAIWVRI